MGGLFRKRVDVEAVFERASGAPTVARGMELAGTLARNADFVRSQEMQDAYLRAMINLTSRATAAEARTILEGLQGTPLFQQLEAARVRHTQALKHAAAVAARASVADGARLAALFPALADYARDPAFQVMHAQTLFQIAAASQREEEILPLARQIEQLPMFNRVVEMQLEFARLMSNLVAFAREDASAHAYCDAIAGLSGYAQAASLQDVHQRAQRNLARREDAPPGPRVSVSHAPVEDPGDGGLWWQVVMCVEGPGGQPVFFRDGLESLVQIVRGSDEEQARRNALIVYRSLLEQGGHRVDPGQLKITSLRRADQGSA